MKSKFSKDEETYLRQIRAQFLKRMQSLPEKHQRNHAAVSAAALVGEVDPLYRALAKQTHDAFELQDRIKAAQAELKEIGVPDPSVHKPRNPNWRAQALERKADLERQIGEDQARLIGLHEKDFSYDAKRAVEAYRQRDAKQRKNEAFKAALEKADAEAEADAMMQRARSLAIGTRRAAGKDAD